MNVRLRHTTSLVGGALAIALAASPAFSQDQTPDQANDAAPPADASDLDPQTTELDEIVVTGSRLPSNEFTSTSPVQVLTAERGLQRGVSNTAQLLQSSTVAAGSSQVSSTISSAFVTDGGPGAATISLRGLGANRTLVLLNGRRAGPAGTRGGVSSFDLNVIPQSALSRVDILKDGASSVYGSDAVAGVVNLITEGPRDGGSMDVFYSQPFEQGGEELNISGTFGKRFDRGHINLSGDYYKQFELKNGDRDFLQCSSQYIFDSTTGERADRIDPRTGQPHCNNVAWGQVFAYGPDFSGRSGTFQFDYDGDLGQYIPQVPASQAADYPTPPDGFFLVGYDEYSRGLRNAQHPFDAESSLIPEVERYTAFIEAAYDITGNVEAYAEVLLNRRESKTNSYRQFWNYTYTADFLDFYYGPGAGGDPLTEFTGLNILSATPITDHFDQSQTVDYLRGVAGIRGDFSIGRFQDWKWDVYGQFSRSDGEYTSDVILQDAVDSTSFKTESCVGTTLPVSGRQCIDVDFTQPEFLAGNLTQAERDFLFDTETGSTIYEQAYVEGFVGGNAFELPAGPLGVALGFHIRRDEIEDTPGPVTLADNSWGLTGAGVTAGSETTKEVFGELSIPVLADLPGAERVSVTLSGRYTDVETSGSAGTYKVGLNWEFTDFLRLRATHGTSFRAPALFELYLADQTSFLSQRAVDPCINLALNPDVDPRLLANCTNPAGPGGGVPTNLPAGGSSATIIQGGGLGVLEPETSASTVVGLVFTPDFGDADISLALDYFDIRIEDEVASLGASVVLACYLSDNFPTDPVCNQFDRRDDTKRIETIRASFLNIAEQTNRGLDLTARFRNETRFGQITVDGQATWTLETEQQLFADNSTDFLGDVGNPEFVANLNFTLERGPWTAFYGVDMIGAQSGMIDYLINNGTPYFLQGGEQYVIDAEAEFTTFHSASLRYDFGDEFSIMGGVANIFGEEGPDISTVAGVSSTIGTKPLVSQYNEAFLGRRAFIRVSKSF